MRFQTCQSENSVVGCTTIFTPSFYEYVIFCIICAVQFYVAVAVCSMAPTAELHSFVDLNMKYSSYTRGTFTSIPCIQSITTLIHSPE